MHADAFGTVWFQWGLGFFLASILAGHGYRKKSLSGSGALAAFVVGLASVGSGIRFGLTMILFYFSSSQLTKFKADVKRQYEEDFKEGGQRDASQVLSCSAPAVAVGLAHFFLGFDPTASLNSSADNLASAMKCFVLGFYACCCGDTWASEIGILDSDPRPRLVLPPFPSVPKGTNGGISFLGTLGSFLGGAFMGAAFWITGGCGGGLSQLLVQLCVGVVGGVGGSLLDSLMGATMQATYWDPDVQKVVSDTAAIEKGLAEGAGLEHITGRSLMSNHGVNLWSASLTGIALAFVGFKLL